MKEINESVTGVYGIAIASDRVNGTASIIHLCNSMQYSGNKDVSIHGEVMTFDEIDDAAKFARHIYADRDAFPSSIHITQSGEIIGTISEFDIILYSDIIDTLTKLT